jgi:hypothetical protein
MRKYFNALEDAEALGEEDDVKESLLEGKDDGKIELVGVKLGLAGGETGGEEPQGEGKAESVEEAADGKAEFAEEVAEAKGKTGRVAAGTSLSFFKNPKLAVSPASFSC